MYFSSWSTEGPGVATSSNRTRTWPFTWITTRNGEGKTPMQQWLNAGGKGFSCWKRKILQGRAFRTDRIVGGCEMRSRASLQPFTIQECHFGKVCVCEGRSMRARHGERSQAIVRHLPTMIYLNNWSTGLVKVTASLPYPIHRTSP